MQTNTISSPSPTAPLRCRISSALEDMDALHALHPWVPGSPHIRPTPETLHLKSEIMSQSGNQINLDEWSHRLFNASWSDALSGTLGKKYHFEPNKFPYNVPAGTNHYVLWFPSEGAVGEEAVGRVLGEAVGKLGGREFVWYVNPKMTVGAIWHVQVFWR
ncbi:hypothetical protein HDU67_005789 [Dinochytrium kinnereticum]|nr:hypothetical protein HDU67_005789 [Dinochytrium kinnereticum]